MNLNALRHYKKQGVYIHYRPLLGIHSVYFGQDPNDFMSKFEDLVTKIQDRILVATSSFSGPGKLSLIISNRQAIKELYLVENEISHRVEFPCNMSFFIQHGSKA